MARKEAGEADRLAANARLETERLRKQVAWRHLSPQQRTDFVNHMKPFRGQQYGFFIASAQYADPEIDDFASSLDRSLSGDDPDTAEWKRVVNGSKGVITGVDVEVLTSATASSRAAASALASWLASNGLAATKRVRTHDKFIWWMHAFTDNCLNPESGIVIVVGKRP